MSQGELLSHHRDADGNAKFECVLSLHVLQSNVTVTVYISWRGFVFVLSLHLPVFVRENVAVTSLSLLRMRPRF